MGSKSFGGKFIQEKWQILKNAFKIFAYSHLTNKNVKIFISNSITSFPVLNMNIKVVSSFKIRFDDDFLYNTYLFDSKTSNRVGKLFETVTFYLMRTKYKKKHLLVCIFNANNEKTKAEKSFF